MNKTRQSRKKVCPFRADKAMAEALDYKNPDLLRRFITDKGRIVPRRISGVCAYYQRKLAQEIKRARAVALLAYSSQD